MKSLWLNQNFRMAVELSLMALVVGGVAAWLFR
jgi:hypothetical protein